MIVDDAHRPNAARKSEPQIVERTVDLVAALLILVNAGISLALRLGMEWRLLVAAVRTLAQLLLTMPQPQFPVALGVVLRQPGVAFEKAYYANQPTKLKRTGKVADALRQTSVWRVPAAKQA